MMLRLKSKIRAFSNNFRFLSSLYRTASDIKQKKYAGMPDEDYLKMLYKKKTGRSLDLDNPVGFNEKLQWLKLYNRQPEYTIMVDKIKVKEYVSKKIGSEHIIPTLQVWDKAEEIDFETLPNQFVLKCNHNSGGVCVYVRINQQ